MAFGFFSNKCPNTQNSRAFIGPDPRMESGKHWNDTDMHRWAWVG